MRQEVTAEVARCLVDTQFPEWAALPITPVEHGGWDNTTYRLGDSLSVRLPTADWYVAQVEKERRWLPYLAPHLPLPVPRVVANGVPGCGYPRPWSVFGWLPGAHARRDRIASLPEFAEALAAFLVVLYAVPPGGGPPPGDHNFLRGAPPSVYDDQTREAVATLGGEIDGAAALELWDEAVAAAFGGPPVWLHGDLSASNVLVRDGRLSAVIDFGTIAVGDPACDLAIAWTFLDGESRRVFRDGVGLDDGAWARGRAWTLWKALITLAKGEDGLRFGWARDARAVIEDVIAG